MNKRNIFIGLALALIVSFVLMNNGDKSTSKNKDLATVPNQSAVLTLKENDWSIGKKDAKVTMVEYLDFECEACRAYHPITKQIKEEYKNNILFVVRYLPLPGHKNSRTAAYAVEAAGKQGKFWEMTDVLFTKQQEWGEQSTTNQKQFEKYAIEVGVSIEQWRKDVVSDEVMKRVDDSYKEAVGLQLQGTPSFFINGKKVENLNGYQSIKKLIEEELKK